jgi:acetyltransferase-like isoleucine patch superfamily enzyme
VFNIATAGGEIVIGDNVGISGATINATRSIRIGNNVLIGSGCLITDTDSHPINWHDRINNLNEKTANSPVVIEENVFIGARSIILKGVTIGRNSVIGAGSVVVKSIPENCIAGGNPAKVIKYLD